MSYPHLDSMSLTRSPTIPMISMIQMIQYCRNRQNLHGERLCDAVYQATSLRTKDCQQFSMRIASPLNASENQHCRKPMSSQRLQLRYFSLLFRKKLQSRYLALISKHLLRRQLHLRHPPYSFSRLVHQQPQLCHRHYLPRQ